MNKTDLLLVLSQEKAQATQGELDEIKMLLIACT